MEDRSFRKRQNMLTDIQAMIVDYKKKSNYSNLVTNHETEEELPTNHDIMNDDHQ